MEGPKPVCFQCKHLWKEQALFSFRCDAFPMGIPQIVMFGGDPHRGPLPDDNGVRFEQAPEEVEVKWGPPV